MAFINRYYFAILGVLGLPFLAQASAGNQNTGLLNPLPVAQELYCPTAYCDLQSMFLLVIKAMLAIIPVLSVLFIIVGGFLLIISRGNEQRITEAKKTILWAVLGLVFAFLAFSIIAILQNFLAGNI